MLASKQCAPDTSITMKAAYFSLQHRPPFSFFVCSATSGPLGGPRRQGLPLKGEIVQKLCHIFFAFEWIRSLSAMNAVARIRFMHHFKPCTRGNKHYFISFSTRKINARESRHTHTHTNFAIALLPLPALRSSAARSRIALMQLNARMRVDRVGWRR